MKYSFLDLFFSNWRWVRKRSKCFWIRAHGGAWVKFSSMEVDYFKDAYGVDLEKAKSKYQFEDWRK